MRKFGIDVSKWQRGFDFDKAKAEGVEFVILRGAYTIYKDTCFDTFYKACKERNLPVGVYLYSMAESVAEAKNEANCLINNVLKGKTFEYPIYFDVEDKVLKALGKDKLTNIIIAFCETLESAGYYVGIYSTAYFLKTYTHEKKLASYDKWIAQWAKNCTYKGDYGMWQFGGETNALRTNKVAGVMCDQDYVYVDYPSIIKKAGLNGFTKLKSVDEVAREVIKGEWGVGNERIKLLIEAGYNAVEVQKRVNAMLTKKSNIAIAKEVIQGKWGKGKARKEKLEDAGYDYSEIQDIVNGMLK